MVLMHTEIYILCVITLLTGSFASLPKDSKTVQLAVQAFSSTTFGDNSHTQILTDAKYQYLASTVTVSFIQSETPIQTYSIETRDGREKYCNDTKDFANSVLGSVIGYIFCTKRRTERLMTESETCALPWHRVLLVFIWKSWPQGTNRIKILHEALRIGVISFDQSGRATILANHVHAKWPRIIFPVNSWSADEGFLHFPVLPAQNEVFRNLHGRILRVPVLHKPPWHFVENKNGSMKVVGGRDHQLLLELAKRMNFRVKYLDPPEHSQGSAAGRNRSVIAGVTTKRGGGVLDLLRQRRVDLFLGDATVTYERSLDLDFSFFTLADSGAFVTRAPRPRSEALALVRPFHWQVWIAVAVTAVLAGPFLHVVTARPWLKWQSLQHAGLTDSVWICIALFLKQSVRISARTHKSRLMIVVLSMTATYVIGDLYCANLTSLLAKPGKERPLRTLPELERAVSERRYELLVERSSSGLDFLRNGTVEARRLWVLMRRQSRALVPSVEDGIALVRAQRGLAFLASRETLHFETIRFGERHFHLSDPLYTRYSAVALQQGCPYLGVLDSIVARLFEAGVLDRMTALEYARLGSGPEFTKQENTPAEEDSRHVPLGLKQLQGAFLVLAIGLVAAGFAMLGELAVHTRRARGLRRQAAVDVWSNGRQWRRYIERVRSFLWRHFVQAAEVPREQHINYDFQA